MVDFNIIKIKSGCQNVLSMCVRGLSEVLLFSIQRGRDKSHRTSLQNHNTTFDAELYDLLSLWCRVLFFKSLLLSLHSGCCTTTQPQDFLLASKYQ